MRWFVVLVICLSAVGCCQCPEAPPESVTIVHIGTSRETGAVDDYTVVEFPDGTRRWRPWHWGKVGDTFMARRAEYGKWY